MGYRSFTAGGMHTAGMRLEILGTGQPIKLGKSLELSRNKKLFHALAGTGKTE